MAGNKNLREANKAKNDEFYTQRPDIDKELHNYKEYFRDKIVFCNCDDPYESEFFKYFALNFNYLGLKKLICTSYSGSPIIGQEFSDLPLFSQRKAYKVEITEVYDENGDGAVDISDVKLLIKNMKNKMEELRGNGDFRSPECVELLKKADIVVTNPPFSLFREYVSQLIKYEKKFLILGNMNAITYREIFALIKQNKLWVGYGFNMSMVYRTPYPNLLEANRKFVIGKGYNPDDGYVKVPAICWFTNLDTNKRHEELILYKSYTEKEYPKYYNYDAINVDKVLDIPKNYDGKMGVPITFLDKHNPEQFKILGLGISNSGIEIGVMPYAKEHKDYRKNVQHRGAVDGDLYYLDNEGHPLVPYARILIKRKESNEN